MRATISLGAALLAAVADAAARPGGQFSNTGNHCTDIGPEFGGWTGKTASAVSFANFPGTYQYTTQGYDGSGSCQSKSANAEGPIAPLADEMTYVLRGPIKLSKFAMYQPGSGSSKAKRSSTHSHEKRHGHSHARFHEAKREAAAEPEAAYGDTVTAMIDGKPVTMKDTWSPQGGSGGSSGGSSGGAGGSSDKAATPQNLASEAPVKVASGQWAKTAHYDASGASGPESSGLAFLMAEKYTDSVSFFSSEGGKLAYSATHQPLAANVLVPDNTEFYIASGEACSSSNPCDMQGPNVTAYHGFKGDRLAVFEFAMPLSGDRACDQYNNPNPDMPAVWSLATHIVNNLQYGNCNGWPQGAGEHDLVEVLSPGSKNMFASMHMGEIYAGTYGDSFTRPTDGTMTLAVVYSGSTVHQAALDNFDFGDSVDAQSVVGGVGDNKAAGSGSVFNVIRGT